MDVESVCTEADLATYLKGQLTGQTKLLSPGAIDASAERQQALDDVLRAIARRTPPIRETDLAIPTELKVAVLCGAEMWLLYSGLTSVGPDSMLAFRYSEAKKRFAAEIDGLTPTLTGGVRGSTFGFGISRR